RSIVRNLPNGLEYNIGDAGGKLSGGEAQRVRIGRGMLSSNAGLVLLDEMSRGLERSVRIQILENARRFWKNSTMIYVTHDIETVLSFERVLVIDEGRIIEDGNPIDLM